MFDFEALGKKLKNWLWHEIDPDIKPDAPLEFDFSATPLAKVLPYEAYDETSSMFINQKSVGFLLEIPPLLGASEEMLRVLQSMVRDVLPVHAILQVHLWASPRVWDGLEAWKKRFSHRTDAEQHLAAERAEWLKKHTLGSHSEGILVRNFRIFLGLTLPYKKHYQIQSCIEKLILVRDQIRSILKTLNIEAIELNAAAFLQWLREILCPTEVCYLPSTYWNEHKPLRFQCSSPEYHIRPCAAYVHFQSETERWAAQCLTVSEFPKTPTQWDMASLIGSATENAKNIHYPFLLTLTVYLPHEGKMALKAEGQFQNKEGKLKKGDAKNFLTGLRREHQDWSFVRERLQDGDKLIELCFKTVIFSPFTEKESACTQLKSIWRAKGWELVKPKLMQWPLLIAALPLVGSEGYFNDLRHLGVTTQATTWNAINVMPLQAENKGQSKGQLLLGSLGQLAFFDPFATQAENFNVIVAAASGAGKTAAVQDYIVNLLADGGWARVIDVGRNYLKTSQWLKGDYLEFNPKSNICLNPFTHLKTDEKTKISDDQLSLLKPLLAIMARPKTATSDEENSWLEKAIHHTVTDYGCDTTITLVARWLATQSDPIAANLAHLLFPYTKEGMYARWFEGKSTIEFNNPLIVLELEELTQKKDLREVILMLLMHHIQTTMYLGNRSQKKSCIIDEAWDLLSSDNLNTAKFIETGYRRARRYNANFVTITQGLEDYYKNHASRAALESSSIYWLFKHKTTAIEQLEKQGKLSFNGHQLRLFKSLHRSHCYSKCMIVQDNNYAVYKLPLDPFSRILYSSKGTEFQQVMDLQENGMTLVEAVQTVARKLP